VGTVRFADADAIRRYVGSSALGRGFVDRVPDAAEPLVATTIVGVFVATTPKR
jgi:hypothetical protein